MGRLKIFTQVALILCAISASARVHKIFPATHDSIPTENRRADMLGLKRYGTLAEVSRDVEAGVLVPVPNPAKKLPRERRYALPDTVAFAEKLDQDFYEATRDHLVIDSAVRPRDVQHWLTRRNRNAAPADGARASTHERGTTIDFARPRRRGALRWLLVRLAYYKARGTILVIEERACLHVFVGGEHEDIRLQDTTEDGRTLLSRGQHTDVQQDRQGLGDVQRTLSASLPRPRRTRLRQAA